MKIYLYITPNNLYILHRMLNEPIFLEDCGVLDVSFTQNSMPGEFACMVSISYDEFIRLLDSNKIKVR